MSNKKKSGTRNAGAAGTSGGIRAINAAVMGIVALNAAHAGESAEERDIRAEEGTTVADASEHDAKAMPAEADAAEVAAAEGEAGAQAAKAKPEQEEEEVAAAEGDGEEEPPEGAILLAALDEGEAAGAAGDDVHDTSVQEETAAGAGEASAEAGMAGIADSSGGLLAAAGVGMAGISASSSSAWAAFGLLGSSAGLAISNEGSHQEDEREDDRAPLASRPVEVAPPDDNPVPAPVLHGRVVDGNVAGATVFYDTNGNWVRDPGELFSITAADGTYSLSGAALHSAGNVVAQAGGIDVLTGQKVGLMAAAGGYAAVNPLTMLLATAPHLQEDALLARLGLEGLDLHHFDPVGLMTAGGDAGQTALALQSFVVAQQVFTIIQAGAELKAAVDGEDGSLDVGKSEITVVARALADGIAAGAGTPQAVLHDAARAAIAAAVGAAPSAEAAALAHRLNDALDRILPAIADASDGLVQALQTGNAGMTAHAVAVVAIAQTALLHAVRDGDTVLLAAMSDGEALQKIADAYADAIGYGNPQTGVQAPIPQVLTVSQAMEAPEGTTFLIADTATSLHEKLTTQDHGPALLGMAVAIVVIDAPSAAEAAALSKLPAAKFTLPVIMTGGAADVDYADLHDMHAAGLRFEEADVVTAHFQEHALSDLAADMPALRATAVDYLDAAGDWAQVTEAQAMSLVENGLTFVAGDEVTMQAAGTYLQTSFEDLQDLGVDIVSTGTVAVVDLGDVGGLEAAAMPGFDPAADVGLRVQAAQLDALLDHGAHLADTGIDTVILTEASDSLSSRSGAELVAALQDAGIDKLHAGAGTVVSFDDLQLRQLLDHHAFTADDGAELTLHAARAPDAQQEMLEVTLAQLIEAGIDQVQAGGGLTVELGVEVNSDNVNTELLALLDQLPDDAQLFSADDEVKLTLRQVSADAVDEEVLVELKLIGIDAIEGSDTTGEIHLRQLT